MSSDDAWKDGRCEALPQAADPPGGTAVSADSVFCAAPSPEQHDALRVMAGSIFAETFAQHYEPQPFEQFVHQSYGSGGTMARDLRDAAILWQAAFHRSEPIGYAKLTPLRAPAPEPASDAVELQQIYVKSEWHGHDVATRLMQWALGTAVDMGASEIYLTVFDHNTRAKRFYARHGFGEVGRCSFTLGDRVDDDRIWRRPL